MMREHLLLLLKYGYMEVRTIMIKKMPKSFFGTCAQPGKVTDLPACYNLETAERTTVPFVTPRQPSL